MSGLAALELPAAPTTLGAAICAVPHLGSLCSSILDTKDPGSGIKIMRLVNKQLRTAMLRVMKGYTLIMDDKATDLMSEMCLLRCTTLVKLLVKITPYLEGWWTESILL